LISQPYLQAEPSGGFLMVEINTDNPNQKPQMVIRFFDEKGEMLYETVK